MSAMRDWCKGSGVPEGPLAGRHGVPAEGQGVAWVSTRFARVIGGVYHHHTNALSLAPSVIVTVAQARH